jgi:hypothetical protein
METSTQELQVLQVVIHAHSPVAGTRLQRVLRVQVLEGAATAAAIG